MTCPKINNGIVTVTCQKEFDELPAKFDESVCIFIQNTTERIYINRKIKNSSVVARGNSSVVAWENSSVEAWENSSVVARENSSVVAWENSSVVARGNVGIHLVSDYATIILWSFAVCWKLAKGKITKKSKTATVIIPKIKSGLVAWLDREGIKVRKNQVVLYKKVSKDFKTQETTLNETMWSINSFVEHQNWCPTTAECGEGKFHACSRPYFCDEFRNNNGDRYVAVEVSKADLFAWPKPDYPHKIAFRKGKVLYEVNKFGKKL